MIGRRERLPLLHVVTDEGILARDDWTVVASSVLEAGGSAIALHLRGPGSPAARILELCRELVSVAVKTGSSLMINDRVDVAVLGGAHGVHLGRRSLSVEDARRLLPTSTSIGVSCHRPKELEAALSAGADYAFLGSVRPTPSHPGSSVLGVGGFERAVAVVPDLPVIAIGGIMPDGVSALMSGGAAGVAAIRGVWDAEDPSEAVVRYISALKATQTGARTAGAGRGGEPPARRA